MTITKLAGDFAYSAPGTVIIAANNATIPGYLKCNGSAIDRNIYSRLFSAIGTTYGSGNGSTTFNIPDYRGCFLRGLDESRNFDTGRALGIYQADEFLSHNHGGIRIAPTGVQGFGGSVALHSSNFSTSTGSTGGTETRPRNVAMIFYISF